MNKEALKAAGELLDAVLKQAEQKFYTLEEVTDLQEEGSYAGIRILVPDDTLFTLIEMPIKKIERQVTSLSYYRGKPAFEIDVKIIEYLIKEIQDGTQLNPVVVAWDNGLLDGWHRLVAYKELGITTVKAFKELQRANKHASSEIFNTHETGMSMYDDVLNNPDMTRTVRWDFIDGKHVPVDGNYWREQKHYDWKIVTMTPDQYINECCKGFRLPLEQVLRKGPHLQKIKDLIQSGTKLPMPVLEYGEDGYFTQEGLHRAIAAKELNVDKIPVLIFSRYVKVPERFN